MNACTKSTTLLASLLVTVLLAFAPVHASAATSGGFAVSSRPSAKAAWTYHGSYDAAGALKAAQILTAKRRAVSVRAIAKQPVSSAPAARPAMLDRSRFPAERAMVLNCGSFPRLGANFEVLAPHTKVYNCIAWSMGITNRWVWPGKSVSDFDREYGLLGYRRIRSLDYRRQPGVEKVVLYGHIKANNVIECTHAARQDASGLWTSKLGQSPLIRHATPEALNGPCYGQPIAVYVRVAR